MARSKKSLFYDKLHRGSVKTIMAFTGLCGVIFCMRFYNFMFVVAPELKAGRLKVETEFLAEGKASEEDLSAA